jgi:hypothetical protein
MPLKYSWNSKNGFAEASLDVVSSAFAEIAYKGSQSVGRPNLS